MLTPRPNEHRSNDFISRGLTAHDLQMAGPSRAVSVARRRAAARVAATAEAAAAGANTTTNAPAAGPRLSSPRGLMGFG